MRTPQLQTLTPDIVPLTEATDYDLAPAATQGHNDTSISETMAALKFSGGTNTATAMPIKSNGRMSRST